MTFRSDETGKHLRIQAIAAGVDERSRAMQALSYGYGAGSQGALASLLLATLGGSSTMGDNVYVDDHRSRQLSSLAVVAVQAVSPPIQSCANDSSHESNEALTAS